MTWSAEDNERIAGPLRELRSKLNDEQLDALDQLMDHLFSLDAEERQKQCEDIMEYLMEMIENQRPVN